MWHSGAKPAEAAAAELVVGGQLALRKLAGYPAGLPHTALQVPQGSSRLLFRVAPGPHRAATLLPPRHHGLLGGLRGGSWPWPRGPPPKGGGVYGPPPGARHSCASPIQHQGPPQAAPPAAGASGESSSSFLRLLESLSLIEVRPSSPRWGGVVGLGCPKVDVVLPAQARPLPPNEWLCLPAAACRRRRQLASPPAMQASSSSRRGSTPASPAQGPAEQT